MTCSWPWPAGWRASCGRRTRWPDWGDEFVVVCAVEHGEEEMARIAERISSALDRPYRLGGRTLTVRASVGGVFVDDPDTDPSQLLSRADDAMYGVKWGRRRQRRAMTD